MLKIFHNKNLLKVSLKLYKLQLRLLFSERRKYIHCFFKLKNVLKEYSNSIFIGVIYYGLKEKGSIQGFLPTWWQHWWWKSWKADTIMLGRKFPSWLTLPWVTIFPFFPKANGSREGRRGTPCSQPACPGCPGRPGEIGNLHPFWRGPLCCHTFQQVSSRLGSATAQASQEACPPQLMCLFGIREE